MEACHIRILFTLIFNNFMLYLEDCSISTYTEFSHVLRLNIILLCRFTMPHITSYLLMNIQVVSNPLLLESSSKWSILCLSYSINMRLCVSVGQFLRSGVSGQRIYVFVILINLAKFLLQQLMINTMSTL